MTLPENVSPETYAVHGAYYPALSEGAIKPPIFATSTFAAPKAATLAAWFAEAYGLDGGDPRNPSGLIYSRLVNPNLEIAERRAGAFEVAGDTAMFASGMAAITSTILTFCSPGDAILFSTPVYGGTDFLLNHLLARFGITARGFPVEQDASEVKKIIEETPKLKMVFLESPSNPTLMLADIKGIAEAIRGMENRPLLVVDNTVIGPIYQQALSLGADLSVYSATKIIGGHSDLIAGLAMGDSELIRQIKVTRTIMGTINDPHAAALLLRSLETLKIRAEASCKKAEKIFCFLKSHSKVTKIFYPGQDDGDEEQQRRFAEQCIGPGSLMSFRVQGGQAEAYRILDKLKIVKLAVSLGGTESLAEHPGTHTHSDIPVEEQEKFGITEDLIRLSVGVEDADDIIKDLKQALA